MVELSPLIDAEITRFGVPGAAVAVAAAGEVVLADGFGRRDDDRPVTPRTLYMIASDTKTFAAATVCQLVEAGRLDLDAPVREVLPWFAMHDATVSDRVTPRDLLAHRTGLPRHSFLTIGDGSFDQSNEQVTRNLRHLQASRPFRQGFGYSNCHYAAAGHLVEAVTGQAWRDVLRTQLLTPLGMTSSGTYSPALVEADIAAPYQRLDGRHVQLSFQTRHYDKPGGGMVSCAEDLGRWLVARLGGGLLSDQVLRLLHTPCVTDAASLPFPELHPMGYGLGTMTFSYRGHRLHVHGGSQLGYAGQVAVVPAAGVGVAVQTNEHSSQLPLALALTLLDHLLGLEPLPWGERLSAAVPSPPPPAAGRRRRARDLDEYVGTFAHPAYAEFRTDVHGDALVADFHGLGDQVVLTHVDLDAWELTFRDFPGIRVPVVFRSAADGSVRDVTLGLEPELPPLVFDREHVASSSATN